MAAVKDMTGQVFGRLTVLKRVGIGNFGSIMWGCKCNCGNIVAVRGNHLRSGSTKSCGCLNKDIVSQDRIGIKNISWKGDHVGMMAAHQWLAKNKPQPDLCGKCKERPAKELSYNHHGNKNWSRNVEDYEWLCRSCHMFKDLGQADTKPMTRARVHRIRKFYDCGAATQKELGELFKVARQTIGNIVNHKGVYST